MGATETLLYLLLDLAIIIAAARLFGALARRIGQPAVIGEIVAGILLGPTVLGRLVPHFQAELFPRDVPLRQLADLGLVFFMFLVGLELDPQLIRQEGRRALSISLSGIVAPFVLGALLAVPLYAINSGGIFVEGVSQPPGQLAFSLFMGAAMCITAFPVLARILVERGLYKSPLGTSALCAAAVDDATAWILLAAIVGLTRTGSAAGAGTAFVLTAIFAIFMVTIGRRLLTILAARYEASGHLSVDQVALIVVGLLLSAYVTEWIGIHSIFGAFIFGTVMPNQSRMTRELTDKIEDFTVIVLLPVFFTVAGLRTNLFSINSLELFGWLVLILLTAIVGKLVGCGLAAKVTGYSTRDAIALGTLMNTRGLTELVILTIGLSLGVLSDRTFAMMVIMALVTTFMAAPILNVIMPRREMVRVMAGGDPVPTGCRVLVALGNPDDARELVDAGIRLTGADRPSELLLVRLVPTPRAVEFRSGLRDEESQMDRSVDAMERLSHQVTASGVAVRTVSFLSDDVEQDLAYVADTQRCDLLLLGWQRPSLERHVFRAIVHRVCAKAPCNVVVFVDREGYGVQPEPARDVLVAATTEEDRSGAVARIGRAVAASLRVGVRIVGAAGLASDAPATLGEDAAAIVIAAGMEWKDSSDFGEPATKVAQAARCPVLVVKSSTP